MQGTRILLAFVMAAAGCGAPPGLSPQASGTSATAATQTTQPPGWRKMPVAPITARTDYGAAWTGNELFVWGGLEPAGGGDSRPTASGALFSPTATEWRGVSPSPLAARVGPMILPFGSRMAVWGGVDAATGELLADGATYDPVADVWVSLPPLPIDRPARAHLVGSGTDLYLIAEGGRPSLLHLDADEHAWASEPDPPAPIPPIDMSFAAWIGRGVAWLIYPASGPRALTLVYDTNTRTWSQDANAAPLPASLGAPMVWTGADALVLGLGPPEPPFSTAAALSTSALVWRHLLAADGCHTEHAVWAGTALLQHDPPRVYTAAAGCRDFAAPPEAPREGVTPVWSGSELLVWSGTSGQLGIPATGDGLIYRP